MEKHRFDRRGRCFRGVLPTEPAVKLAQLLRDGVEIHLGTGTVVVPQLAIEVMLLFIMLIHCFNLSCRENPRLVKGRGSDRFASSSIAAG